MNASELSSIETLVGKGKAVVSADNSVVVAMMQGALKKGRSATFYVSRAQGQALMRWYWTPGRIKEVGMEPVTKDERAKIEAELGVKDMGPWFSNRIECPTCGSVYGAFEFVQQGLQEHGRDWVGAVLELKSASVVRINPAQDAFCQKCNQLLVADHWYRMQAPDGTLSYGCCKGELP